MAAASSTSPESTATLTNVTISGNTAYASGGGIANEAVLTLINSTVAGNSVTFPTGSGGGIFDFGTATTLTNDTISGNSSVGDFGGGIDVAGESSLVMNNTIVANTPSGGDISNVFGTMIGQNDLVDQASDLGGLTNVLVASPLLAPLGNYGGSTQTMPLLPGSPAIAAGNPALAVNAQGNALTTDQRGFARLLNGNVDIGACESEGYSLAITAGSNQSTPVYAAFSTALQLEVTPNNANDPVTGGVVTFNAPATGPSATITPASATINANGAVSVQATANNVIGGPYLVSASMPESSSVNFSLTNTLPATVATVSSSANPSVYGQPVTLTATVSPSSATGTVTFMDGSATLGTSPVSTTNGVTTATLYTTTLNVGEDQSITAIYSGDTNFSPSTSPAFLQTVDQSATTTVLTSSANPSPLGQSLTFTATVAATSPGAGNPTGSVTFMEGSTTLGSAPVSTSNGITTATISTAALSFGANQLITAIYSGDSDFLTSTSAAFSQSILNATTTSLISSADPSQTGQSVTFTANVAATITGAGIPTGTVTFLDGSTPLGTSPLSTTDGVTTATFTTSTLSLGAGQVVTAVYSGDANFIASTSAGVSQTVIQAVTTQLVVTAPSSAPAGSFPTITVKAIDAFGHVTPLYNGTITFSTTDPRVTVPGNYTFTTADAGSYTFTDIEVETAGPQTVTVTDPSAGLSGSVTINVLPSAPFQTLISGPQSALPGVPFALTLDATDAFNNLTPLFKDTVDVNSTDAAGTAPYSYTFTAQDDGSHTFDFTLNTPGSQVVTFTDETHPKLSQSITINVPTIAAQVALSSSAAQSVYGSGLVFTATLTGTAGLAMPTGTVQFLANGNDLGAPVSVVNGVALSPSITSLNAGSETITADYSGDSTYPAASSTVVKVKITPAPLSISVSSTPQVYGSVTLATPNYTGFVNGDTAATALTGTLTYSPAITAKTPVGIYDVTPSGVSAQNYAIKFVLSTLYVTPAVLTVTAPTVSIVYGTSPPPLQAQFSGFVNGDTQTTSTLGLPTLTIGTSAPYQVGSYPINITPGTLQSGNYTFEYVAGALECYSGSAHRHGEECFAAAGNGQPDVHVHDHGIRQ